MTDGDNALFEPHLRRWRLTPDGNAIATRTSRLLPVKHGEAPAMLKIAMDAEEKRGNALMLWWAGDGAAKVLARDGDAILLPRAAEHMSLAGRARAGGDDGAIRIICATLSKLHRPRPRPRPMLVSLPDWFADLPPAAATHGGLLTECATTARMLLSAPRDTTVLHGDIHHGNVLYFADDGWLAIDPKGLLGERGFDYANLFCNPDHAIATDPVRFRQRLDAVGEAAGLDRQRLLQWILAWAGLSATWLVHDGLSPETPLAVAALAAAELNRLP